MSEDPYKVLGVGRKASEAEIRKAYRELAKKFHPDLHPGDKDAEERFKAVSQAYDLLGDSAKRKRFDAGEIDATGAERPQHTYRYYADADAGRRYDTGAGFGDFADVGDIFADLFGRRARGAEGMHMRGADVRYELAVDFLDAIKGAKKRVTMPDGRALDLTIPAGLKDGQTLRLKGKGMPGSGRAGSGDAFVHVRVKPHPTFVRKGDDIEMELPITLAEAVLGGKVAVPTATGTVTMTVPKGANTGRVLRLKGKGAPKPGGKVRGDQLVRLVVVLPDKPDAELEAFLKDWAPKHAYDPRASKGG